MKNETGNRFLLLGIENQSSIHYAMPLRVLTYDVLGYNKQWEELKKKRRTEGALSSTEFLSGMKKEDSLHPIFTLVLYYGEEHWDGPLSLHDMLHAAPKEMEPYVVSYHMNLVEVIKSEKFTFHHPEVEALFTISRSLLNGQIAQVQKEYKDVELNPELIGVIGEIVGSTSIIKQSEKGECNMCKALDDYGNQQKNIGVELGIERGMELGVERGMELGVEQGISQMATGIVLTLKQLNLPSSAILSALMENCHLSMEQATSFMDS